VVVVDVVELTIVVVVDEVDPVLEKIKVTTE
jgi:hypothetical protein